jgi:hypothetical protein
LRRDLLFAIISLTQLSSFQTAVRDKTLVNRFVCTSRKSYIALMTTVQEIEHAIEELPGDQFAKIHDWIVEKDWKMWDAQIERDSAAGKLDFLVQEALHDAVSGNARPI